jgi:anti-anti-sigma regulatory factor
MFKMNAVESAPGQLTLELEGDLGVAHVAELRQQLLNALSRADKLTLSCSKVEACDFFALQTLCSAHQSAMNQQKKLLLDKSQAASLIPAMKAAGFFRHSSCSRCCEGEHCLWCV